MMILCDRGLSWLEVSKIDDFCIIIEELCIKNEELCIKQRGILYFK